MDLKEYPFYGIGIIAFAVAESDGEIQQRERRELMEIIREWTENIEVDFDVAEIIFSILSKTKRVDELSYEKGMEYIRKGSDSVSEKLKEKFIFLLNDIARSFPPVTDSEKAVIDRFEADIKDI